MRRKGELSAAAIDCGWPHQVVLPARLPELIAQHAFSDGIRTRVVRAAHGDSSGVRGAAWLWPIKT
jgi:fructokinase